ncbi:MAG TPA: nucleotide exchange factor GrpE [Polyangiaceae bacterium]|nr:nucleotide exchange factor GrpE [Polyangiaceae bacterium]
MATNDQRESDGGDEARAQPAAAKQGAGDEPGEKAGTPLEEALAEVARIRDQLLRTAADFDNFRKRTRRELDDAHKRGKEEFLRELLPVFDNLERAAVHAGQASDAKAVADGVGIVLKQFQDTLGKVGIKRIPAVGVAFDPSLHEAIQQVETDDHPPGTIVAEVQPGYAMGDRLVRAAMVVVAKPRPKSDPEKTEAN